MPMPSADTTAPDFTLLDQEGEAHTLSSYKGRWVLIYFYPKDDTPGCTKEACAIRDAFPQFDASRAVVLGISPDSVRSHKKFAEKYELPFTLLADEGHVVADAYGAHMHCEAPEHRLSAPTRKLMTVRFAIAAAQRMNRLLDPQGHADFWE